MPQKVWKTGKQVTRLIITRDKQNNPRVLGKGNYATTFFGRIRFDRKPIRVAIKKFDPKGSIILAREGRAPRPMTDVEAKHYQATTNQMRKKGVRILTKGLYQVTKEIAEQSKGLLEEGEWVEVSRLRGSTEKGSKIERIKLSDKTGFHLEERIGKLPLKLKKDLIDQAVRIANAGHYPAIDSLGFRLDRKGQVLIQDTDVQAFTHKEFTKRFNRGEEKEIESVARVLILLIKKTATNTYQSQVLFNHIMKNIKHPNLRTKLKKTIPIELEIFNSDKYHNFAGNFNLAVDVLQNSKTPLSFRELLRRVNEVKTRKPLTEQALRTTLRHLGAHGKTRVYGRKWVEFKKGKYNLAKSKTQ
ncbi:MAG: hypothetical protein ABH821_00535 [archaeon]